MRKIPNCIRCLLSKIFKIKKRKLMDIGTIQSLITTVGFPIVCVIALGWFIYKAFEKFTSQADAREQNSTA